MSITIKDVAKHAGVSIATVSRIVNNQPGFGKKTKEKVLKSIEELGYTPNAIARGLVGRETRTIGVLLPKVSGLFASKLLEGIETTARKEGYSVFVCHTDSKEDRSIQDLQVLKEKQVDGMIYASDQLSLAQGQLLEAMTCPIVFVSTQSLTHPFPYVKVDDYQAAYDGTSYLLTKGHEQIAFIGGEQDDLIAGKPRDKGFRQAMKDHGMPINEALMVYGDFRFQSGKKGLRQLLAAKTPFSAVFASSDEMAVGVLSEAYDKGISVPKDLAVLGYDNTMAAEMAIPPLTTIAQPLDDMGKQAVTLLLTIRENRGKAISNIEAEHEIVERKTVLLRKNTKGLFY
ncbi:LacI family transcriptional regulator [Salipaludibacillus keqinensis]|uniref:LacI family transcriptional regulator n=1 Tax=Salipaludibacillus keqinensis TaxID=2045207 RepID=A0A323TN64_9BACI|nr:substrate-binding domain-containing protein [Salipaludibacillus keqinensis]PYZ94183.1 LacI family transcriptional regulator [Salipaludibacillus keqinensis]